jgi:FAD:protein FMN transferase
MRLAPSTGSLRSTGGASRVHRQVTQLMGMPISLALRGRHAGDDRGRAAWADAVETLRQADRVFSTYRPDSFVSRLGRGEVGVEDCPSEVAEVLRLGEQARVESDGAFDVRRPGPDGGVVLDPSGVVKGWAVERSARVFDALDETDFCLSAGGDMVCRVAGPGSPAWQIGIEDPRTWNRLVAVVPVRNGAVATSGLSRRGAHIVDARTGVVPSGVASVSVVGDSLVWADIDATAAFAHGRDALRWLSTRPARKGVVVWEDGRAETYDTAVA